MLRLHSTGHSLASSARQQGTHSLHRPANKTLIQCRSASSSRDGAGTAVTSTAAQTAPTACAAAAVAAGVLLGSWLQPAAALALPQQELEEIRQAIEKDFSEGQYYVTGNLTSSLYDPDCTFKDPTTNVKGVKKYTTAVAALFVPTVSRADLISSNVAGPNSIALRWRLEGKLKIGDLPIKPYTGSTLYTVDEASGLISRHEEEWDITAVDAFVSTLFPGLNYGAPPAPPVK